MSNETNIYAVRPDGTSLWIPETVAASMAIQWGDHLTRDQYEGEEISGLIARRLLAEKQKKNP